MLISRFLFLCMPLFFTLTTCLEALDAALFYQKLTEPTPLWMMEQIHNDLASFQRELSRKFLNELFIQERHLFVRLQVVQGELAIEKSPDAAFHPAAEEMISHVKEIHRLKPLPDIDFIFTGNDSIDVGKKWPVFCISKSRQSKGGILMPDRYSLRGLEPYKSSMLEGNQMFPWESKKPVLFFRGGYPGNIDPSHWKKCPRPRLMALSVQNPTLIDAKFDGHLRDKNLIEIAREEGYMGDYVPMKQQAAYKYLMDVDADGATTPRFPVLLYSNCLIFKNTTDSMLWFYRRIKPYQHFIPVKENLSDLLYQLKWAKLNEGACQRISHQARELAAEVLSQENVYVYLYRLMEAYSFKQQGFYDSN